MRPSGTRENKQTNKAIRAMQDTQLKELEAERSQKENDVAIRKAKTEEKKD
jgi:hypothetical protein